MVSDGSTPMPDACRYYVSEDHQTRLDPDIAPKQKALESSSPLHQPNAEHRFAFSGGERTAARTR